MGVIARQSIKASIIGFAGVAIGAISKLFVFTKFLTTEEIGLLDVITKLTLLLITFFILGSPNVIKKFYHKYYNKENDTDLLSVYFIFSVFSILFSSVLYIVFKPLLVKLYSGQSALVLSYIYVPLVSCIFYSVFQFFSAIASIKYRIVVPNLLHLVVSRLLVVIIILLYGYQLITDFDNVVYLYVLSTFIIPALGVFYYVVKVLDISILKKNNFSTFKNVLNNTKQYNFYLILSTVSLYIVQAIDVQMISVMLGLSSAGVYSIVFYMGGVINLPKKFLGSMSVPLVSKYLEKENIAKVQELYELSALNQFVVGAWLFLLIWLNIDSIFTIIPNGQNFSHAKYVMLFIGISKVYDMLTGVNYQIIEASVIYKYNLLFNILLSVLVVVLNLVFIPLDNEYFGGVNGSAFASMIAMAISNTLSMIILHLKFKILPFSKKLFISILIFAMTLLIFSLVDFKTTNAYLTIVLNTLFITIVYAGSTILFKIVNIKQLRRLN